MIRVATLNLWMRSGDWPARRRYELRHQQTGLLGDGSCAAIASRRPIVGWHEVGPAAHGAGPRTRADEHGPTLALRRCELLFGEPVAGVRGG